MSDIPEYLVRANFSYAALLNDTTDSESESLPPDISPSTAQSLQAGASPSAQTVANAATNTDSVGAKFKAEVVSRLPSASVMREALTVAAAGFEAGIIGALTDGEEWMATTGFPGQHTYNVASFDAQQRALIAIQRIAAQVEHSDGPFSRIIDDVRSKFERPFDEAVVRARFSAAVDEARKGLRDDVKTARRQHAATVASAAFITDVRRDVSSGKLSLRAAQASFEAGILTVFGKAVENVAESAFKEAVVKYDAIASYKKAANDIVDEEAQRIIQLAAKDPDFPLGEMDEFEQVIGKASEQVKATIAQGAREAVESSLKPDPDALRASLRQALDVAAEQAATRQEQAQLSGAAKSPAGSDGDLSSVDDLSSASDTDSFFDEPLAKHEAIASYKKAANGIIDKEAQRIIQLVDADTELSSTDKDHFKQIIGDVSEQVKAMIALDAAKAVESSPEPDPDALRANLKQALEGTADDASEASSVDSPLSESDVDSEDATSRATVSSIIDEEAKRVIEKLADGDEDFTRFLEMMSDRVKDKIEQAAREAVGGSPDRVALRSNLEQAFSQLVDITADVDGTNRLW